MLPAQERRSRKAAWTLGPLSAVLIALLLVPTAFAREPTKVTVGKVRLAVPRGAPASLLVPVRYPIELSGRPVTLRVALTAAGRAPLRSWRDRRRASSGLQRRPERRGSFAFVHRIDLSQGLARRLRGAIVAGRAAGNRRARMRVSVRASAILDVNRDGRAEIRANHRGIRALRIARSRHCSTVPQLRAKPGRRVSARLPACGSRLRWSVAGGATHGVARIQRGRLIYRPARRFRGTESIRLRARPAGPSPSAAGRRPRTAPVHVKVLSGAPPVVRAIGDSVTAGFGYYDDGTLMRFTSLLSCKPSGSSYDDACSSNSTNRSNEATSVDYAPDYGLSNNVSWVAQWANEHGVTNYENLAVTGTEPSNWTAGGQFHNTTKQVIADDPDYVLMTMGANPLLSDMLFGVDNMGCAIWSDAFGRYRECIEEAFAGVHLRANLEALYQELVAGTEATIYLMQYHLSVPASALAYSSAQIAMMGVLLNREIASVAAEVSPSRLTVVSPPHFNVGIDISPVYPSSFSCSRLGFKVDGRSVQSTPTQDELVIDHPLSFCSGPVSGPPWVISGDTGIHPSAAGYAQMAARLPAPG